MTTQGLALNSQCFTHDLFGLFIIYISVKNLFIIAFLNIRMFLIIYLSIQLLSVCSQYLVHIRMYLGIYLAGYDS